MNILRSFLIACSFLTILPVPAMEWTEDNMRPFCLAFPLVGIPIGALWGLLAFALSGWSASPTLRGVVMALCALALTGGIHMDGLMDTCDALFSRRDREARLNILSDPHAGAFAVMGCAAALLLQSAIFAELLSAPPSAAFLLLLGTIPLWSRLGMGLLLNATPFAREDGLARTLGALRTRRHTPCLVAGAALLAAWNFWTAGAPALCLPLTECAVFLLWRRSCLTAFGGVAGDLLGTLNLLSETAMLLVLREML